LKHILSSSADKPAIDTCEIPEPGISAPEKTRKRALFGPSPRDHVTSTSFRKWIYVKMGIRAEIKSEDERPCKGWGAE
jgi:hypothetical protein